MTVSDTRPEQGFGVDDQLCFAAYSASRSMVSAYRRRLSPHGLTYTQFLVLLVLWERPETSMQDICRALSLDSGTLTPVLKRMTDSGLIGRRRGVDDERTVIVTLLPAGEELRGVGRQAMSEIVAATGLSREELDALRTDLHRLSDALDEDA